MRAKSMVPSAAVDCLARLDLSYRGLPAILMDFPQTERST